MATIPAAQAEADRDSRLSLSKARDQMQISIAGQSSANPRESRLADQSMMVQRRVTSTGRFLQTDPIGYEDNLNLYAYVGNDPVNARDPSGQCETSCGGWHGAPNRPAMLLPVSRLI